jgi:predicted enzyme related to lactoylglutathione lyase
VKAAKAFYTDVIGWSAQPLDGANETYTVWLTDSGWIFAA